MAQKKEQAQTAVAKEEKEAQTNAASEEKSRRVVCMFASRVGEATKAFAHPADGILGLRVTHNPESDLPARNFDLKIEDLKKHEELLVKLALFGASVHLRNCINTEKDEETARGKLEARLDGFKNGIYRTIGEGTESVPLVMKALRLALETRGDKPEVVEAKVEKQLKAWHEADKKGKTELRKRIMSVKEVQDAYAKLTIEKEKGQEKVGLDDI